MSDTDLKEKEEDAVLADTAADFSPEEQAAFGALADNDQVGKGFTDEGAKPKRRFRITRKQGIAGGVAGLIIGGGIGFFSIVQGPLQIVHFAQLLHQFHFSNNENFGDGRTFRFMRNLRANTLEKSHLGTIGNRVADRFEARFQSNTGLRSAYSPTGRLVGYEVIDRNKSIGFLTEQSFKDGAEGINVLDRAPPNSGYVTYDSSGKPVHLGDGNFIDISHESSGTRRMFQRIVINGSNSGTISGALGARLLGKRGLVDWHPLRNRLLEKGEDRLTAYAKWREERSNADSEGTRAPDDTAARKTDTDGDGKPDTELTPGEAEIDKAGEEALQQARDGKSSGDLEGATASNGKKLLAGGTVALGLLCTVRSVSQHAEDLQYANIVLPLMRTGVRVMSTGYQVMSGQDVNLDELGSVTSDLNDTVSGTSWAEARSIQAEEGHVATGPDMPDIAKPSRVGEKPAFLKWIDTAFDAAGSIGTAACSSVGQFAIGVLGGFGNAVVGVIQATVQSALGIPDPTTLIADWATRKLAGEEIKPAKGAELGNYANYGARLAANDQAIAMGGRQLSGDEVAALDANSSSLRQQEFAEKSLFAKVFDINDVNSVAGNLSMHVPQSAGQAVATLFKSPINIFSSLVPKVHAQTSYDYGFDEYGFSLEEQNNPLVQDPFENAAWVESSQSHLEALNNKYGKCFSMSVNPESGALVNGEAVRYDEVEKDSTCHDGSEALLRYRFYLADMVTGHSLDCYEGDESSCEQLGFSNGSSSPTQSAAQSGDFRGQDTSSQTCKIGTDGGVGATPDPNIKIRLCKIDGITVNVAIEANVKAIVDGGKTEGLTYGGGGYRSYDSQVKLRQAHCGTSHYDVYEKPAGQCSPPTAIPGHSMHEWGLAVDFTCNGVTIKDRNSRCYLWIEENQDIHKLLNLPSEAWHWSSTGN